MNVLDLLLKSENKAFDVPSEKVKIKRLSKALGEDVIFDVKSLSLDRLEELRGKDDFHSLVVLEGVKEPNLKSNELKEKFGAHTPVETLKKMLTAGEIEDLYIKISHLSGYGMQTYEEVKKN